MKKFYVISNKLNNLEDCMVNQHWKPNDKRYFIEFVGDDIEVKDEYHSMSELYDHRRALNIALFNTLNELYGRSGLHLFVPKVFKSKNHHPECDPMFEGYFIVFAVGKNGIWTSYHYELKYWDHFKIRETEHSLCYPINHEDAVEFFSNLHWKV